jgi:hypothetical protein
MPHADLLVPLVSLPGLDPVGLVALFGADVPCLVLARFPGAGDGPWCEAWHPRLRKMFPGSVEAFTLDLADPATADRLARYVAGRVGLAVGATAPDFGPGCWEGVPPDSWWLGGACFASHNGPPIEHCTIVPTLAALDPADDTRTASGARVVDLRALAVVAVEVGRG